MALELLLDAKAVLGEGPSWDERNQRLIWVDIPEKKVHVFDPSTGQNRSIAVDEPVGAAVLAENGSIIAALKDGFHRLDPETGDLLLLADPESGIVTNRFNDGKCDAKGRFWAGTMALTEKGQTGALYCLHPDGTVTKHVTDVTTSNGIAWSPDWTVMYYIDTPTRKVDAFDFDLETGSLSNRRTVLTIPEGGGWPDGMTSDAEGMIWVAQWDGHQVSRWNPNTGELLETVQVPAPKVTSCVFGGPDLDELYITTARIDTSDVLLAQYPHAGGLFRYKAGVKGSATYRYAGPGAG